MFFIGVFGIDSRESEIKGFAGVVCPDCGRLTQAVLFTRYTYLHIFFIPTLRWNRKYYVKLRCCGSLWEAQEGYAKQLKGIDALDMSRLKKVTEGFGEGGFAACADCGRRFDESFSYCPYCGAKR